MNADSARDERRRKLEELAAGADGEMQFLLECMDVLSDEMTFATEPSKRLDAILNHEYPRSLDKVLC
jgi:hypothetical protein